MALPVLPVGPAFHASLEASAAEADVEAETEIDVDIADASVEGDESGELAQAEAALRDLPLSGDGNYRSALLEACSLQLLTTSVISPAKVVPGEGPPLTH